MWRSHKAPTLHRKILISWFHAEMKTWTFLSDPCPSLCSLSTISYPVSVGRLEKKKLKAEYEWRVRMHSSPSVLCCHVSEPARRGPQLQVFESLTTHSTTIGLQRSPAPLDVLFLCQRGLASRDFRHRLTWSPAKYEFINWWCPVRSGVMWESYCEIILPLDPCELVEWFHRSTRVLNAHKAFISGAGWGESASHQARADLGGQICFQTR